MTVLDIEPLNRSIMRLQEGLDRYQQDTSDTQIRDGLIQRFEFTYELAHKTLKRFFILTSASPQSYQEMLFQDLIREGNDKGLLRGEWKDWRNYRDMRSRTSHTYDEEIALKVVSAIPDFLQEAIFLEQRLKERLKYHT